MTPSELAMHDPIERSLASGSEAPHADGFFFGLCENADLLAQLSGLFDPFVSRVARLMDFSLCTLALIDTKHRRPWLCARSPDPTLPIPAPALAADGLSVRTLREARTMVFPDVTADRAFRFPALAKKKGFVSLISSPIRLAERGAGVLNGYTARRCAPGAALVAAFDSFAAQAALMLENRLLRDELVALRSKVKRSDIVERAKAVLMSARGFGESDAYHWLRRASMNDHRPLVEVARDVLGAQSK